MLTTTSKPESRLGRMLALRPRLALLFDYGKRVYNGLAEDNAFFLAGGLAFSLLLALVPFLLLVVVGISFTLGRQPQQAADTVVRLANTFLPTDAFEAVALVRTLVDDVLRTRGAVGISAGLGFIWTSTRLFGSLRAVLAIVFSYNGRGIVAGKLFDVFASSAATLLVVIWAMLSTYLSIAESSGLDTLAQLGVRAESLGFVSYLLGRLLGFAVVVFAFFVTYRTLPARRPPRESALVAALVAATLFEAARELFAVTITLLAPQSLYTGSIAVIVSVVFWMYYGALLFVLGAEVVKAHRHRLSEGTPSVA